MSLRASRAESSAARANPPGGDASEPPRHLRSWSGGIKLSPSAIASQARTTQSPQIWAERPAITYGFRSTQAKQREMNDFGGSDILPGSGLC